MRKQIATILLIAIMAFTASAHYSIHSLTAGVKVESGSKQSDATKGMELKATDVLIIPSGGAVEIYNELDKRIYQSTSTGRVSLTRLMMDARKMASDNRQNVTSHLRFAQKGSKVDDGRRVYVEKGMVRRSLTTYDPEGGNIEVDPRTLGRYLAYQIVNNGSIGASAMPVVLTHGKIDGHGLYFRVVNNIDFPVYFNILKVETDKDAVSNIEISSLGQPDGSYVLLPGQSITRENFDDLPEGEKQIIVMAHSRYDLDAVVEEMNQAISEKNISVEDSQPLPIYILSL